MYNGHKHVHWLKFQSVALPNGLIGNIYGPVGMLVICTFLLERFKSRFSQYSRLLFGRDTQGSVLPCFFVQSHFCKVPSAVNNNNNTTKITTTIIMMMMIMTMVMTMIMIMIIITAHILRKVLL